MSAQGTTSRRASLFLGFLLCSCSPKTALVPHGPHVPAREAAPIRVHHPPPPAKVEVVPLRRNKLCRYLDGHWSPKGSAWIWKKGAWVLMPPGCYYAAPQTRYEELEIGTTLVHRPGVWLSLFNQPDQQCEEARSCPAANTGE